jgi:hypothetical protein
MCIETEAWTRHVQSLSIIYGMHISNSTDQARPDLDFPNLSLYRASCPRTMLLNMVSHCFARPQPEYAEQIVVRVPDMVL